MRPREIVLLVSALALLAALYAAVAWELWHG